MSEPKHTPWTLTKTPARIEVRHKPDAVYAFSHGDEANAQMIVRAVNSHEALMSALESMVERYEALLRTEGAKSMHWDETFTPSDWVQCGFNRTKLEPGPEGMRSVHAVIAARAALAAGRGEA